MAFLLKKKNPLRPFVKNEIVVALCDLPGVPKYTAGKVKVVNGFEWRRYWVFFDNGVRLGSIDEHLLARPKHRQQAEDRLNEQAEDFQKLRQEQKEALEQAIAAAAAAPAEDSDAGADVADGTASDDAAQGDASGGGTEAGGDSGAGSGTEPIDAPPSAGSGSTNTGVVEVPPHLIERSASARSRLSA